MDIKQHALRDDNVDVEMTVGQWLDAVRDYRLSDSYTTAELIAKKFDRNDRLYEYNSEHYKLGKMSKYLVGSTIVKDTGDKTFYENKTDLIEVNDDDDIVRIYTTEEKPFKKQFSTEEGNMETKQFANNPLEGKSDLEISKFVLDLDGTTTYNPDELKAMADICFGKNLDDCGEYLCDLAETRKVYLSQHADVHTPTVGVEEIKQEVASTEEPTSEVCPHCGQTPCCCDAPTLASERTAMFSKGSKEFIIKYTDEKGEGHEGLGTADSKEDAEKEFMSLCPNCEIHSISEYKSKQSSEVPVAEEQVAQFSVDGNAKAFKDGKALADAEPNLTKDQIYAKFEESGNGDDWQNFVFGYMCVDKKAPNIGSGESKLDNVSQNSSTRPTSKVKYFSRKRIVTPQKKIWE